MRYLAGTLYGLAAASGTGLLLNSLMIGLCIAVGTIAFAFALEGMIRHELWRAAHPEPFPKPRRKRRPF
jgi:hypothetical protein